MKILPLERRRRLLHVAFAIYALSYLLPSYRVQLYSNSSFKYGWEAALWVETMLLGMAGDLVNSRISGAPRQFIIANGKDLQAYLMMLSGAAANHLFLLAYAAALFRWLRTASASAWLAAVAAISCLLPGQLFESHWFLGPGYFVWCAAPALLGIACGNPFRRATSVPQESQHVDVNPLETPVVN